MKRRQSQDKNDSEKCGDEYNEKDDALAQMKRITQL